MSTPISRLDLQSFFGTKSVPTSKSSFEYRCHWVKNWMLKKFQLSSVRQINRGYCFIWAYLVDVLSPDLPQLEYVTTDGHVVLKNGEQYYDATSCNGVTMAEVFADCSPSHRDGVVVDRDTAIIFWGYNGRFKEEFVEIVRQLEGDHLLNELDGLNYPYFGINLSDVPAKINIARMKREARNNQPSYSI